MNTSIETEISLLGFLTRKPMHGYDVLKEITDLSGFGIVWHVKTGKLYAMLHRLEDRGYITSKITQEGNRPQKTEYSITKEGKTIFKKWLVEPVERGREFRIRFLLKLYFALESNSNLAQKLIVSQREECELWLAKYSDKQTADDNKFIHIVRGFRQTQIEGYLNWLNWCQKYIEEEEK